MSLPRHLCDKYQEFCTAMNTLPDSAGAAVQALVWQAFWRNFRGSSNYTEGTTVTIGDAYKYWLRVEARTESRLHPKDNGPARHYRYKRIGKYADALQQVWCELQWPLHLEVDRRFKYRMVYKIIAMPAGIDKDLARLRASAKWYMIRHSRNAQLKARFAHLTESRTYSGAFRSYILEQHKHVCDHCGAKDRLEVDHKVAWAKGGRTTIENARVLCSPCNKGVWHLHQKKQKKAKVAA